MGEVHSGLVNVYAHDTFWLPGNTASDDYGPPPAFPWVGSNEEPDFSSINVDFYRSWDQVLTCLLREGIIAHLYLKVYNKKVNWPMKHTPEDDLFFRYVIARYQAYPNVIWDFSKETYYECDKEYVCNRMELVRDKDGYQRLRTVHDDPAFCVNPQYAKLLNFHTAQQHTDFYNATLLERTRRAWPAFNSEFGYENGYGRSDARYAWVVQEPEEVIDRAYQIAVAGGYFCYYYDYTAFDVIDYRITPTGYKYFKILYLFFASIKWWQFEPHPELSCWQHHGKCLAIPGKEYVIYANANSMNLLNLPLEGIGWTFSWLNTHKGQVVDGNDELYSKSGLAPTLYQFKNPFPDSPGILHIEDFLKI